MLLPAGYKTTSFPSNIKQYFTYLKRHLQIKRLEISRLQLNGMWCTQRIKTHLSAPVSQISGFTTAMKSCIVFPNTDHS